MLQTVKLLLIYNTISIILAYLADMLFGDPSWRFHPVRIIGNIIFRLEQVLYKLKNKTFGGFLLFILSILLICGAYGVFAFAAWQAGSIVFVLLNALGIWASISIKDMAVHIVPIAEKLNEGDLLSGKSYLALVVSRDVQAMDGQKIASSAVETVGENFVDAVLSPLFYSMLLGGFGGIFFKVVSTLDSMVGYINSRYERFGMVSARMDDVMGFIPARFCIIPVMIGSFITGARVKSAMMCFKIYRKYHASPNSGHGIASFAGALGVKLGGPTSYGGVIVEKPYIYGGSEALTSEKIYQALRLYKEAAFVSVTMAVVFLWILITLVSYASV